LVFPTVFWHIIGFSYSLELNVW